MVLTMENRFSRRSKHTDPVFASVGEMEARLGDRLRALRLERNLDQATLAGRAGVGINALKRLETGGGSTLKTLVGVLRALNRQEWLNTIAPVATINPLTVPRAGTERQRATRFKKSPSGP